MTFDELKQLDPRDPGRWPLPVRLGAIALFFVVLSILLLYFLVWNSNKDELASREQQEFQPLPEQGKDFYAERPIQIRLTGTYHQMGEFVSGIAALPRIVTLHNVEIKQVGKDSYDQLQMDVTAKTYRYLDEGEVAAAESARKAKAATTRGSSSS